VEAESNGEPTNTEIADETDYPERMDLQLLVFGKKMGLSFEEINMLRVSDLVKFIHIFAAQQEERDTTRRATQSDFDDF